MSDDELMEDSLRSRIPTLKVNGSRATSQWMIWAFKLHGCADCGIRFPDVALPDLHCDHRDPATKVRTGSRSLTKTSDGLLGHGTNAELLIELMKCDVVCADCHKKRHRRGKAAAQFEQGSLFTGTGEAWRLNGH